MAVPVQVDLNPNTRKVEAALARIKAQAKGVNLGGGAESINKLSRPLGKITGQASEFQKSLEASNARVLAFGASVAVINKLSQAFGALVTNTIKVEASFAKINTILGGTQKQLEQFGNGIFKVAQQTGTSFDQVAEGALELARQGLSVEESLSRVSTALKLVRVSGIDAEKAVGGLTAAIKGFEGAGLTVAQIADKLAEVDTKFAVSTEDLINGLERASASARVAGVSFDELLGVVTTVQERTQRGGAVIGNAFKTIFARLSRTDTLQTLKDLGIEVLDTEGNVRSAIPLFQELAVELDKLGLKSVEAGEIIQKVAGVRQRDILISLVEDLNSGQSQFAKALQVSAGAAGALDAKNSQLNQTLEALINNLTVGSQKLASVLGDLGFTDAAGDILKAISSIVNGITDILQGEGIGAKFAQGLVKGVGSVLTGPGLALISAIFLKLFVDLAKFGATSLKQILGINKAAAQQATLQQSVLQTLLQNENIQREILALEGNKVAQEQLLLKIYNQQAAALARVQKAAATVTPGLFGAGMRGGEGGVAPKGRASGGYIAAEARDVSRGVGGAPANSKVVSIPNFAFGGGQRGTIVANTSEYIVPNFAGGGDAIFNRDMVRSMGLPAGARKINAAGGYVPNFATKPPSLERLRGLAKSPTAEGRAAAAELQRRTKAKAKLPMLSLNATGKYGMIVPDELGAGNGSYFISETKKGPFATNTKTENTVAEVRVPIYGLNKGKLKGNSGEKLAKDFTKLFTDKAIQFALQVSGGILPNPARRKEIEKTLNVGSARSAAGSVFESGVAALFSDNDFDDFQRRGASALIDFKGGALQKLKGNPNPFDIPKNILGLEAKYSRNADMQKSTAEKIYKVLGRGKAAFASGYIPNFAGGALEEAIGREKAAGLPINQIRINQSGKLRNAQNPMGLAVTNTRDEPTGRIPNFAVIPRLGSKGSADKAPQSAEKMSNSFDGLSTKLIGLQLVVSATTNAFSEQNKTLQNIQNGLGSFLNLLTVLSLTGVLGGKNTGFSGKTAVRGFQGNVQGNKFQKTMAGFKAGGGARSLLGPAALATAGTDAALKILGEEFGVPLEGGLLQAGSELLGAVTGSTKRKTITGATGSRLKNLRDRGFKGESSILGARSAISSIQAELAATSDEKTKRILTGQLKATQSLLEEFKGLQKKQETLAAKIKSGEVISKEAASRGVSGFFGRRETRIIVDAARKQAEQDAKLRKTENLEEIASIEIEKERLGILEEIQLLRNEGLNDLTKEVVEKKGLSGIEKESLNTVLSLVDENKTLPGLVAELKTNFGLTIPEAEKLLEKAKLQKQTLSEQEERAKALLKIKEEQLIVEAKIAEAQRQFSNSYSIGTELVKQSRISKKERSAVLGLSLSNGTALSPQQKRDIEFEIGQIERQDKILQITGKQADIRAKITLEGKKKEKDQDALDKLNAQLQTLYQEEASLERINALEEKRAKEIKNQTKLQQSNEIRRQALKDLQEDVPDRLANNLESSLSTAFNNISTGAYDSLGNVMLQVALDFGQSIQKELANAAAKQVVGGITSSSGGGGFFNFIGDAFKGFGFNSGGLVSGGSGVRDDIPAKLTGGEYVIKKSAVQKYGVDFLDRLNSKGISQMQSGGFFVPGTRGQGAIKGKENLLAFANQEFTSGATDIITSSGSGAFIDLEDQSARLSTFGRFRESPARRGLKDAQNQALGLYNQQIEEERRIKEAEKQRSRQLKNGIFGSFLSAGIYGGVSALGGGLGGIFNRGITPPTPSTSINSPTSFAGRSGYKLLGSSFGFANGGMVSGGSNALVMGGEYIMSASAAAQIGRGNLDNINMMNFSNGGGVGNVASSSGETTSADIGEVNITINMEKGDATVEESSNQGGDVTQTKEFAKKVKDVVVGVINEEKRVSGSLFSRRK